jgi:hypothetical protein
MQLRALVTTDNSSKNWDLRCKVREGLVDFMQTNYAEYLPRLRAELFTQGPGAQPDPPA